MHLQLWDFPPSPHPSLSLCLSLGLLYAFAPLQHEACGMWHAASGIRHAAVHALWYKPEKRKGSGRGKWGSWGNCEMNRFENHFLNSLIAFCVAVVVVFWLLLAFAFNYFVYGQKLRRGNNKTSIYVLHATTEAATTTTATRTECC